MQDPNEDTEWNDALRARGIIGPREQTEGEIAADLAENIFEHIASKKTPLSAKSAEDIEDSMGGLTVGEVDAVTDEVDGDDEEAARRLYREKRMAEMKAKAGKRQFGEVIEITANSYIREINQAGKDIHVVLLLYNTGLIVCRKLKQIIGVLACKFPHTKFVQSVAQNCIPNYPDKNLPTVFVYFEDNLLSQFCGPSVFGGESMTVKDVEWGLSECGAVNSELTEDPRARMKMNGTQGTRAPLGVQISDQTKAFLRDSDSDDEY
jgi:hypothetical protein